jgi:hypothetical protein
VNVPDRERRLIGSGLICSFAAWSGDVKNNDGAGQQRPMDQAAFSFSITPLSAHTGAEIRGIDLRQPVNDATHAALNQAFVDHAVLCIRDQKLSAPEFLEAMQLFGEIFPQHNSRFAVPECPGIHYISNQDKLEDGTTYIPGEGYHTDHSNDREPPKATVLHAVRLPNTGGDTQFVNMYYPNRPGSGSTGCRRATCTRANTASVNFLSCRASGRRSQPTR